MTLSLLFEASADALIDSLRMLPFLFAAFLILEAMEHYSGSFLPRIFRHKKAGPAVGAILGCVPQCGFSALISSLYCGGIVTIGTLLAVYLSTSDEAILILMAQPEKAGMVGKLIFAKLLIAIPAGYLVDLFWNRRPRPAKHVEDLCDHCGCHDHHGIIRPALNHSLKLFAFLLIFNAVLNILIDWIGLESLSRLLLGGTILQPFLTALIGLIPNCAASVLITQLFLDGVISFGSAVAGLCTGAGIGLVILFRTNKNMSENFKIIGMLYVTAVIAGIVLQLFCIA